MHIDLSGGRDEVRDYFTLDLPPFAGRSFTGTFAVCGDPLCKCTMWCGRFSADDAPTDPLCFQLDLHQRKLTQRTSTKSKGWALGQALIAEASTLQWESFWKSFQAAKNADLENMDLESLNLERIQELIPDDGLLVDYRQVFPWAEPIGFTWRDRQWVIVDLYCTGVDCDCTTVALDFFCEPDLNSSSPEVLKCALSVDYDYHTATFETDKTPSRNYPVGPLVEALLTANPKLI